MKDLLRTAADVESYFVIAACRRLPDAAELNALYMAHVKEHPVPAMALLELDLLSERSVADAAAHVKQMYGSIDILINNAGTAGTAHPDDPVSGSSAVRPRQCSKRSGPLTRAAGKHDARV